MIDKFNFYDVYGYFLPGFALLALIWVPFGIVTHHWPSMALASAVASVIFAYILGHLIQIIAHHALPSTVKDLSKNERYPSDLFLDDEDVTFSEEFKKALAEFVQKAFGLDLAVEKSLRSSADLERTAVSRRRQDAFFLCRGVLIGEKNATYAEQFEGMYTLMRGLAAAFALGFAYVVGWALGYYTTNCLRIVAISFISIGLIAVTTIGFLLLFRDFRPRTKSRVEKITFVGLMMTLMGTGYVLGEFLVTSHRQVGLLGIASLSSLALSLRCFGAYKSFAREFAKAVWRDFAGHGLYSSLTDKPH